MNEVQDIFTELFGLAKNRKVEFMETLLDEFILPARGIWSDEESTDAEKVEAFKWLHELSHRIWNIRFELKQGEDNDSITRLHGNMKFYSEQSDLLRSHLAPTLISAYRRFKAF